MLKPIQIMAPKRLRLAEDFFSAFGKIKLFANMKEVLSVIAIFLPQFCIENLLWKQDSYRELQGLRF